MYGACSAMARCASPKSARRRLVGRARGLVEQRVDVGVREVAAIEARRRHLVGMEHAAEDVGVDRGAADPLQRVELEVAVEDVGVERRELVAAEVDVHADRAQVLLDHRPLQPGELEVLNLERQAHAHRRAVAVRVAVAGLVEQRARLGRVVVVRRQRWLIRPRFAGQQSNGRNGEPATQILDDGLAVDRRS